MREAPDGGRKARKTSRARERARLGRLARIRRRTGELWQAGLEKRRFWVIPLLVIGTWVLAPRDPGAQPRVAEGSIASVDYLAPRDLLVPDGETTAARRFEAEQEVLPVYDFDPGVHRKVDERLSELFAAGRALLPTEEEIELVQSSEPASPVDSEDAEQEVDLYEALAVTSDLELTRPLVEILEAKGFSKDLEDRLRSLTRSVLTEGVVSNQKLLLENRVRGVTVRNLRTGAETLELDLYEYLGYPDELESSLDLQIRSWRGVSPKERRSIVDLLLQNLEPNLLLNRRETLDRRSRAAEAVGGVFHEIREGQVIVRKGDAIDAAAAKILNELAGEDRPGQNLLPVLGLFLLLSLAAMGLWLGLRGKDITGRSHRRMLSEACILLLMTLLGARLGFFLAEAVANSFDAAPFNLARSYMYALPFASLGLLGALLYGRSPAILLSLILSLIAGQVVGPWAIIFVLVGSFSAIFLLEQHPIKARSSMIVAGLVIGLANSVSVLLLAALEGGSGMSVIRLVFDVLCAFAGGMTTAAVASIAVPVFESLFGITTNIKLVELANTNLPLLQRLALEAPGTFQHSLMVANLARAGCEAIRANSVLAYTGALYHDIGKVLRPEYFIENQRPGHNLHDKLAPTMSALILISHVKEGLELARSAHLPVPILDTIEQHHGSRLISYFYNRAVERNDPKTGAVQEDEFRYPGPCPQNREMGVLMLADGVEAASRSLNEPTPARLRSVVRKIFEDCLQDGQLDATDLTLRDLVALRHAFLRVLGNAFHRRIDYPGFDFREERSEKRLRSVKAS